MGQEVRRVQELQEAREREREARERLQRERGQAAQLLQEAEEVDERRFAQADREALEWARSVAEQEAGEFPELATPGLDIGRTMQDEVKVAGSIEATEEVRTEVATVETALAVEATLVEQAAAVIEAAGASAAATVGEKIETGSVSEKTAVVLVDGEGQLGLLGHLEQLEQVHEETASTSDEMAAAARMPATEGRDAAEEIEAVAVEKTAGESVAVDKIAQQAVAVLIDRIVVEKTAEEEEITVSAEKEVSVMQETLSAKKGVAAKRTTAGEELATEEEPMATEKGAEDATMATEGDAVPAVAAMADRALSNLLNQGADKIIGDGVRPDPGTTQQARSAQERELGQPGPTRHETLEMNKAAVSAGSGVPASECEETGRSLAGSLAVATTSGDVGDDTSKQGQKVTVAGSHEMKSISEERQAYGSLIENSTRLQENFDETGSGGGQLQQKQDKVLVGLLAAGDDRAAEVKGAGYAAGGVPKIDVAGRTPSEIVGAQDSPESEIARLECRPSKDVDDGRSERGVSTTEIGEAEVEKIESHSRMTLRDVVTTESSSPAYMPAQEEQFRKPVPLNSIALSPILPSEYGNVEHPGERKALCNAEYSGHPSAPSNHHGLRALCHPRTCAVEYFHCCCVCGGSLSSLARCRAWWAR
jgi:hypothetical protein